MCTLCSWPNQGQKMFFNHPRISTFDDVPSCVCCTESSKDTLMGDYKKDGGQRCSWVTKCQTHGQSLHYI